MFGKVITTKKLRVKPFFRWYDLWVGVYVDTRLKAIYICPLPTIGLKIWRELTALCPECGNPAVKSAIDTGDGWFLTWDCPYLGCIEEDEGYIEWPFEDEWLTAADLEHHGFTVL